MTDIDLPTYRPATDLLIGQMRETLGEIRAHAHPERGEDFYCLNLVSWLGERMGPVLRRLADEQAETQSWKDRHTALAEEFAAEVDRLRAGLAARDAVVEAAQAWAEAIIAPVEPLPESEALYRAVQALPNEQEPCGICAGYGCPDCRSDLSGVAP